MHNRALFENITGGGLLLLVLILIIVVNPIIIVVPVTIFYTRAAYKHDREYDWTCNNRRIDERKSNI